MNELMYRTEEGVLMRRPIDHYPDGIPFMAENWHGSSVSSILLRPKTLTSFCAALFWVDAMLERQRAAPRLVIPFVPGARQDRLNLRGDYLFTLKSIAQMINARHFSSVKVLDPHSDVAAALIERCEVVTAASCIKAPPNKYAAVVAPDAGAEKRAGLVSRKLGVPLLHAWKTREIASGELNGFGMQPHDLPTGSLVLVVDDICDGGGTFVGLADVLDAAGLKAHLWVTHGLFSKGTTELLKRYPHVYTTDSVDPLVQDEAVGLIRLPICEGIL